MQDYNLSPDETIETLSGKYKDLESASGLGAAASLIFCWVASHLALLGIAKIHANSLGDAPYKLVVHGVWLMFPTLAFGFLLGFILIEYLFSLYLGDRKLEYRIFQEMKYGRIARLKVIYVLGPLCILPFIATYALIDTYTLIGPNQIVIDRFAKFVPEEYEFSEVKRILLTPIRPATSNENLLRYEIQFHNNARWNSENNVSFASDKILKEIASFVSTRAGIPIESVSQLDSDVEEP